MSFKVLFDSNSYTNITIMLFHFELRSTSVFVWIYLCFQTIKDWVTVGRYVLRKSSKNHLSS